MKMESYRKELLKLNKKGPLTAELIVNAARKEKSPLHDFFEWNDSKAGEKWRHHQARMLINVIIEPVEVEGDKKVHSYEIIKTPKGRQYKHVGVILDNEDWRQQVIHFAVKELIYWLNKYSYYSLDEFESIALQIEELKRRYVEDGEETEGKYISGTASTPA